MDPERIWATWTEDFGAVQMGKWADSVRHEPLGIEYVRADLYEAEIARLTAALEEAEANINLRRDFNELGEIIQKIEAERDTARAETAMAFEAAAKTAEAYAPYSLEATRNATAAQILNSALSIEKSRTAHTLAWMLRALTPAHATAALEARDREMRIAGYRIAQAEAERLGAHIVAPEHCAALTTPENGGGR